MYRRGPGVVGMVSIFLLCAFVVAMVFAYPWQTLTVVLGTAAIIWHYRRTTRKHPASR